jgi:hypothetical protein
LSCSSTPLPSPGRSPLPPWASPCGRSRPLVAQPLSVGANPTDFAPSEAVAGRMQDAQRMDAWFQRMLAKGSVMAGPHSPLPAQQTRNALDFGRSAVPDDSACNSKSHLSLKAAAETAPTAPRHEAPPPIPPSLPQRSEPRAMEQKVVAAAEFNLQVELSGEALGCSSMFRDCADLC